MINNQGRQVGGGSPATRSHKSLSSRVAGSLQKALTLSLLPGLGLRRAPTADSQSRWLCSTVHLNFTEPHSPLPAHQAWQAQPAPWLHPEAQACLPPTQKSREAFDEGFPNIFGNRTDKYELDGSTVRCTRLTTYPQKPGFKSQHWYLQGT